MINRISNINFSEKMTIETADKKGLESILEKIPGGEERDYFESSIRNFQEKIEAATPEDAEFKAVLKYDDWYAGGDTLKYGKCVKIGILGPKGRDNCEHLHGGTFAITNREGRLWRSGLGFKASIERFLADITKEMMRTYNLADAIEKSRRPVQRRGSLLRQTAKD